MQLNLDQNIQKAKRVLQETDALLITAGAGMGVDSGLPDFRGTEGFWNAYPKVKELGLNFEQMANPKWFKKDPHLAWAFYGHRLELYRNTTPHEGFTKLLELCKTKKYDSFIFTSNVDGQFQKAGFSDNQIMECHGSIHHMQCVDNCQDKLWNAENVNLKIDDEFMAKDPLPLCPYCKSIARPNIMMFGDFSWNGTRTNEQSKRFKEWTRKMRKNNVKIAVIEMGAGMAIPTVRSISERRAMDFNVPLIRINPRESFAGTIEFPIGALEALNYIIE